MDDFLDFFNMYFMGSVEIIFGFYFFVRILNKKIRFYFYLLFAVCVVGIIHFIPSGIVGLGLFVLLLAAGGILICHADWKLSVLYAILVVGMMQLSYGIVKSLLSMFYPMLSFLDQHIVGTALMLSGYIASLTLAGICYHIVWKYFSNFEAVEKQYLFLVLIPILMIFIMDEYINSFIYGRVVTDVSGVTVYTNHYQMLIMQLLGMISMFCILYAYKKLLMNFRLSTELSLLEQEEHSLNQYVEEAKAHYEKTKSFRHDIKNHIAVIKNLLQNGQPKQALNYIKDMEDLAEELSFPCSTNNPVVDILAGNKLGIARSMGIDVYCSLLLPYPSGLRDIDVCIILSNALDNAIHACKDMDGCVQKYIRMSGRLQGDFLLMEIENSFQGSGMFKKGTGLSNVKNVVEKYHGAMSVKTQGTNFVLHVMLIIPQHLESGSASADE